MEKGDDRVNPKSIYQKIDEKLPQCGVYFYCPFSKKETYWNGKKFGENMLLQAVIHCDIAVYQNVEQAESDLPKAAASIVSKSKEFVFDNRKSEKNEVTHE